ncbi:hypothetical protein [Polycladidibacter hongkongensis]|uniref:hypothetical protein n=1 Tax=Polycladidibacter hongkongensis TaxID=1647556 RepID=UPI0008345EBF|nr:hypothetical protein [Pseudovibrio hongkongensis]
MVSLFTGLVRRMQEPSTFAGLPLVGLGLAQLFGVVDPHTVQQLATSLTTSDLATGSALTLSGLAAMLLKEGN